MNKLLKGLLVGLPALLLSTAAVSVPVDLSTFTAEPGVVESG